MTEAEVAKTSAQPAPVTKPPAGLMVSERGGAYRATARAGGLRPAPALAFLLAALWTGKWGFDLFRFVSDLSRGSAPGASAELFIISLMMLAGIYCAGLCLWAMIGREKLLLHNGSLTISNPWLFGLVSARYDVARIQPFQCTTQDCGLQPDGEGCCCRWSSVDYALTFGYEGRRVPVFPHISREAKDWLRDQLNARLKLGQSSGSPERCGSCS